MRWPDEFSVYATLDAPATLGSWTDHAASVGHAQVNNSVALNQNPFAHELARSHLYFISTNLVKNLARNANTVGASADRFESARVDRTYF